MSYTLEDLIGAAVSQRPNDFEEAFNTLMLDKVTNAIEQRKMELAQTMFNPVEEAVDEVEEDTEEIEEADIYTPSKNSGGGNTIRGSGGQADLWVGGNQGSAAGGKSTPVPIFPGTTESGKAVNKGKVTAVKPGKK